jgi:hemolysin III
MAVCFQTFLYTVKDIRSKAHTSLLLCSHIFLSHIHFTILFSVSTIFLNRPLFRGVLHLICAVMLPLGLKLLWATAGDGNEAAKIVKDYTPTHLFFSFRQAGAFFSLQPLLLQASCLYISANLWCYGMSGLYHVGRWSIQNEILLQKLDHCGVAVLSTGTMLPCCMLLLPSLVGGTFAALSASCCALTCWYIFQRQPSVIRQVLVPCAMLPFLPWMHARMNECEFSCVLLTVVSQGVGLSVFLNQRPNPLPSIFGYHEIFHVFVVIAGCLVFLCNLSIVRRSSGMEPLTYEEIVESLLLANVRYH